MDNFFGILLILWFSLSTFTSAIFFIEDYRNFNTILKECSTQGYIQNNHTRIICSKKSK